MRLIAPYSRIRIADDIFETGDQTLLEVSVDLGEDARASKCSFSLYDPGLKIGGKYQAISFKVGGIEVPPDLLQSPQAVANTPTQVDGATGENSTNIALPTGSGGAILSRPKKANKAAQADYYKNVWNTMSIRSDRASMVQREGQTAVNNKPRYESISKATGVPWYVIAAIHFRECSYNFKQNLANGDPLTRKTTREPAGRIPGVAPPYTFEQAAIDALNKDNRFKGINWGDPVDMMWKLESYNGYGYLYKGDPSPYLLAGTQHYDSGMYVRDGEYSRSVKDPRIGVMAIIYYCLKAGGSTQTMAPVQQPTPQQTAPAQTVTPPVEVAAKGTEIIVELGFEPDQLTAYHFIHTGTDCEKGGSDRTTFTGQSIRWLMTRRLENKSFENITLKQLAESVCRQHNLKLEMEGNGPTYQFLDQTGITTYELLLRQCRSIGYTLKDKGDTLIVKPMRPEFTGYVIDYGTIISLKFSDKARSDRAPGTPSASLSQPDFPSAEAVANVNRQTGQTEQQKKDEKAGTGSNSTGVTGAAATAVTGNVKPQGNQAAKPPQTTVAVVKKEPEKVETSSKKNANGSSTTVTKTTNKTTEKGKVTTVVRTDYNTSGVLSSKSITTVETTKGTEITTEETNAAGLKNTKKTSNTKVTKAALDSLNLKPDEPTAAATANPTPNPTDALGLPKQPIGTIDLADGRAEGIAIADEAKRIRGYESSASVITTPEILTLTPGSIIAISGELVPEPFDREWRVYSVSHKFPGGVSDISFYTPQAAADKGSSPVAATGAAATGGTLAERIIATMQQQGMNIAKGKGEINIAYVEGINPDGSLNDDKLDFWNDLRCCIEFKDGKPTMVGSWIATTEPGKYYTQNPLNPNGAFRIAFGQYKAWQVGVHRDHEALVQRGNIKGYRDKNKDGERTGDPTDSGSGFGVNQHWGGDSSQIGRWSAGCLVGQTRQGHREFMKIVKGDSRYKSGYMFETAVLDGKTLAAAPASSPPSAGTTGGDIPTRIYQAAIKNKGANTKDGPDGGRNACAFAVNKFCIEPAGLQLLGAKVAPWGYPVAVAACEAALRSGRGKLIERSQAVPGDIWIQSGKHIGIISAAGGTRVLSNSSSKGTFSWDDAIDRVNSYYGGAKEKIFRVLS